MADEPTMTRWSPRTCPNFCRKFARRTPARMLTGRAGAAYRTERATRIARGPRRRARCGARRTGSAGRVRRANSCASGNFSKCRRKQPTKTNFCCGPISDGISRKSPRRDAEGCSRGSDLQMVIGDGLSVPAVSRQVPALLPLIFAGARRAAGK